MKPSTKTLFSLKLNCYSLPLAVVIGVYNTFLIEHIEYKLIYQLLISKWCKLIIDTFSG